MAAAAQTASFKALGVVHSSNPQNCSYAVSADGSTVLGTVLDAENEYRAQRWQNDATSILPISSQPDRQYRALAMSADTSTVVGFVTSAAGVEAFLFKDDHVTYLGGLDADSKNVYSLATAVSNDGSVTVGNYLSSERSGVIHA